MNRMNERRRGVNGDLKWGVFDRIYEVIEFEGGEAATLGQLVDDLFDEGWKEADVIAAVDALIDERMIRECGDLRYTHRKTPEQLEAEEVAARAITEEIKAANPDVGIVLGADDEWEDYLRHERRRRAWEAKQKKGGQR